MDGHMFLAKTFLRFLSTLTGCGVSRQDHIFKRSESPKQSGKERSPNFGVQSQASFSSSGEIWNALACDVCVNNVDVQSDFRKFWSHNFIVFTNLLHPLVHFLNAFCSFVLSNFNSSSFSTGHFSARRALSLWSLPIRTAFCPVRNSNWRAPEPVGVLLPSLITSPLVVFSIE